ncbi:SDR family NAD(P)-dependent oxidoreductase [Pelagicoccus mobilis]|uniref:SDR family oxidoreductase n=1 Tax=Pelagicoccus mobilis TaxID=415221 RepID=A0A934RX55_9BACT|nr:SDR family oxidoreductase [Pelagicoccus mobilis]MBK1875499.1 SDR family oxidoreductase [Pelagicoccus mobilis]
MTFQNKTAVVTGGASGVGLETAKLLVERGANVAVLDWSDQGGEAIAPLGEKAIFIKTDVSNEADTQSAVTKAIDTFGEVDILVNNAAVLAYSPVHETSLEDWNRVMGVNITGAFLMSKYCIQSMLRKGGGSIVHVGSAQSFMSQEKVAPYVASKTALLGLMRSIAVDYTPTIRCNTVCPSTIDTPMLHWAMEQSPDPQAIYDECVDMHLLERIAQPQEIAELILFLASDLAANITGQAIRSDGGIGIKIEGSKR